MLYPRIPCTREQRDKEHIFCDDGDSCKSEGNKYPAAAQERQGNFRGERGRDWKMCNAIPNVVKLKTRKLGFQNGSELTAGKKLVSALSDIFFDLLPPKATGELRCYYSQIVSSTHWSCLQ